MTRADEDRFPARVYWLVALVAVLGMLLLWWFTSNWNVPLPEVR